METSPRLYSLCLVFSRNKSTTVKDPGCSFTQMNQCHFFVGRWSNFCTFFHHLLSAPITANLEASLPIYPSQFNHFFLVQGEGSCTPVRMPNYQLAIKEAHLQTDIIIKLCESQKNGLFPWCWHHKPHQRGWYLFQIIIPWWLINLTIFLFWETNKRNLCLHFMAIYHSFGFQIVSLRSKERGRMVFCCLTLRAKLDDTSVFSNC